jgi:hypothetical protein
MPQYTIDIGAAANDGTGDPLRTAFNEVNLNFDQVFNAGPVLSNVRIANNTILTTTTNGNLILAPNGTGVVQSNVHIVPNTSNIRNLGSSTQRWNTVYVQYLDSNQINLANSLSISGTLTVNQITSDDSSFVTIEDGLDVNGAVTADNVSVSGYFNLPVYANTTVRDNTITSAQPGMMIFVTGTGMQVRGATAWNTVAGTAT